MLSLGSDLRQMRDCQHLLGVSRHGNVVHGASHVCGHLTAHAGVNFVQHDHWRGLDACHHGFEREHEPCALTAARHFHQRQEWQSRVCGEPDFRIVHAQGVCLARGELPGHVGVGHFQLTQQGEDVFDESLASLCPVRRQCGAGLVKVRAALCFTCHRLLMGFFQPLQGLHLFRQSLQEFGEGFRAVDLMLSHGAHERVVLRFQLREPCGVGLLLFHQVVQRAGEVGQFDANTRQALKGLVDLGVHTLQAGHGATCRFHMRQGTSVLGVACQGCKLEAFMERRGVLQ